MNTPILAESPEMELLRFTTAGSVDDGKSTLIGRLLYDSKSIFEDQYESIRASSEKRGEEYVNLALLTDGLRAEREQGITIDVAYRYFATPKRKFIIADTPGHIQYTRNMVTGASTAHAAIILIDARKGVIEQTRRHSYIASLLRIPHLIVCVNKMDLVDYNSDVFNTIRASYTAFAKDLGDTRLHFIPISALKGDHVVEPSGNMPWFKGTTLLELLETLPVTDDERTGQARFPVQYVIRPMNPEYHDYRAYAGRIAGGTFRVGDNVKVLPSGLPAVIKSINRYQEVLTHASAPESVSLVLDREVDISRGDMIVPEDQLPAITQDLDLMLCWMSEKPLQLNGKYLLKHTTRELRCVIKAVEYKVDISALENRTGETSVGLNDIARVKIRVTAPLFVDSYARNRNTGSLILIDEGTNATVAAGMII
ncbi:MAG TPA: GTP-binding protein [Bacteroidia bacterium]|jgi:sulfate adenylyltransferase subunit 1|nr:GTP-binding protein [Bacteroidia bacterium]